MNKIKRNKSVITLAITIILSINVVGCDGLSSKTDHEHVAAAKDYLDSNDLKSGIIELKSALQKNPENAEARYLLGKANLQIGDGPAAEKELLKAQALGIDYNAIKVPLGRTWLLEGEYQKILDEIKLDANDIGNKKAVILSIRGDAFRDLRQFDLAKNIYLQAIKADSEYINAYVGLSRLYFRQKLNKEAKDYLSQAESRSPDNPEVLLMKGDLLYAATDYPASEKAYTQLLNLKRYNLRAMLGLSLSQLANKRVDEAINNLDKILKVTPKHLYSNYLRGLAAFELKNYEQAKESSAKVLNEAPGHLPSLLVAGSAHFALAEYEQAANKLEKVIAAAPAYEYARRLLGATHEKLGNNLLALEILKPLAEKTLDDATLLSGIGALAMKTGNIEEANEYLLKAAALQPDNARIRAQLGLTQLSLGQVEQGLSELSAAAETVPGSGILEVRFIQNLLRTKRFVQALEESLNLQTELPKNTIGYVLAGIAHKKMGDLKEAEKSFLNALEIKPAAQDASFNLAMLYINSDRDTQAKQVLKSTLKEHPDSRVILTTLARLEARQGNSEGVRDHLETLIDKFPDDNLAALLLSRLYLAINEPQKSIDLLQKARKNFPGELAVLEVLGKAQIAVGKPEEAINTLEALTQKAPQSPGASYWLGVALKRTGQLNRAASAFEKALAMMPNSFTTGIKLANIKLLQGKTKAAEKVYLRLNKQNVDNVDLAFLGGKIALAKGEINQAVTLFSKVYDTNPSINTTLALARVQIQYGSKEKGVAVLNSWLEKSPNSIPILYELGAYHQTEQHLKEAAKIYQRLTKMEGENWIFHNELAMVSFLINDINVALKHAQIAYQMVPGNAAVMDTYGLALMAQGDMTKAKRMFERADDAMPDNSEIRLHLAQSWIHNGNGDKAMEILKKLQSKKLSQPLLDQVKQTIDEAKGN